MKTQDEASLSPALLERIAARLGFTDLPEATPENLDRLYHAWCRRVPFDNIRKLIHVRCGNPGTLPGTTPADFFHSWLDHGTGGTCWSGSTALHALLTALGFHAERGIATMLAAPDLPPNHGTVRVNFGGGPLLVDSSILHDEPIPLEARTESPAGGPAARAVCHHREDTPVIRWRPLNFLDGLDCRIDRFGASHETFAALYESTRAWSPFNYALTARLNRRDSVIGFSGGEILHFLPDGTVVATPADEDAKRHFLIEEIGISEEMVSLIPEDLPTPPPPGSKTAARLAAGASAAK